MITIDLIPGEAVWYGCCYRWPTGGEARDAWAAVSDLNLDGSWHVGIFRHQRIGLDSEPVLVSAVGDLKAGVEAAEISLMVDGGIETELHPETWVQLCKRRIEAIIALDEAGAGAGRHRILHPEGGDLL